MKQTHFLRRLLTVLLALVCLSGLLPTAALAAGPGAPDTITLADYAVNGMGCNSNSLGFCRFHRIDFDYSGETRTAFCAQHGMSMAAALAGHTWGRPQPVTDPTVTTMMAYFYAHTSGNFTDQAHAMGLDELWDEEQTWMMNAWVQAVIWRYEARTLGDPAAACAEELVHIYNRFKGTSHTSIDDSMGEHTFRDFARLVLDLGEQGVWGECTVYEYDYTGPGTHEYWADYVQSVMVGELNVTHEQYKLVVKKVDATNPSLTLPGARFRVVSQDGSFSQEFLTGQDGTHTLDGLAAGVYTITELAAPEGYEIDRAVQYVTLPGAERTVTVTFEDSPVITGTGSIRKVDSDNPTRGLAGAVIRITGVDNNFVGTYTTGAGGYLTDVPWESMPVGSYTAEEVTPPVGYTLSPDVSKVKQSFRWDGRADVDLVFENDAKVKVRLVKLDDSGRPLPGAVFSIIRDGQLIGTEATGADGTITVTDVTEGLYAFVEVFAPAPYACLTEPVIVHVDQADISGGGTVTVTAVDKKLPTLRIVKTSSDGTRLGGVHFRIAKIEDGARYLDRITGQNGEINITDLEPGVYSVRETATVSDHILDLREYHVELFPGQTSTLTIENQKRPNLIVYKKDADTGEPIPGTVFTVRAADGHSVDEIKTDSEGRATLSNLLPGVYEVAEKSVPAPYLPDAPSQLVTLYANREHTVYFENHKKPALTVNKMDSITGEPVSGAKFQVWYRSNNTATGELNDLGIFFSDENGRFFVDLLRDGWYKITELEPAAGYAIKEPATQEIYIKGGEAKTVTIKNTPLSALVVWKYDSVTGAAVEGAMFQVKYLGGSSGTGGTVIGTYKTGHSGSFTVTGLKTGTYIVSELSSDGDHVVDTPPQTAYISGKDQDVVQLSFGNSPMGALLVKKVDASTGKPLSDVEFLVTTSEGAVVGSANGKFVTDSAGTFLIDGLVPGTTLVVKEARAREGYLLDDAPQTAQITSGQTVILEFRNKPLGNLVIHKLDSVTKKPLAGVQFKIAYADGRVVDGLGGKLSSSGLYTTDANGQIVLSGITGTLVVTEVQTLPGYAIDENTHSQTVVVNPDDTQSLTFYNTPVGGLELIKVSESDRTVRIPNTTFEIRRMDGGLVNTVTTDRNGRVYLPLEAGDYYAVEVRAASGYRLDATPTYFTVRDGRTTTLTVTNRPFSGVLIHKTDSATGKGIQGASFLLYDGSFTPVGQFVSDNNGFVYIDGLVESGRYYLRELDNPGYVPDSRLKTVYVTAGETTLVTWENIPVTGQLQITKTSADYNAMNGWPAGTPIPGTVFEVYDRVGNLVDTVQTDKNGVAATRPLPLGRYRVVESRAADFYVLDRTPIDAELEFAGQIVRLAVTNRSVSTGVAIAKKGYYEVMPGQSIRYTFSGIASTSNVALTDFFWRDTLPVEAVRLARITTGTYSAPGSYKIVYRTNLSGEDCRMLADDLSTQRSYVLEASPAALGLASNEYVTEVLFVFGVVPAGFRQDETSMIDCTVLPGLTNGLQFVNRADAGGIYDGKWIQATAQWTTRVYAPPKTLPRTGY